MLKKLLLILSVVTLGQLASVAQEVTLSNAGFENDLSDWTCQSGGGAVAEYLIDATNAKEGLKSMKVVVTKTTTQYWDIQAFNTALSGTLSGSYRVTLWAKAETSKQKINFNVSKATANYDTYAGLSNQSLTSEWKMYSFALPEIETPLNDLRICFNFLNTGTYWVDGITITPSIVVSATVLPAGNKLQMVFVEDMIDPKTEINVPFIVKSNGANIPINSIERDAVSYKQYNFTLAETIGKGHAVEINYFPGTIATTAGKEIPAFSFIPVNNSTAIKLSMASGQSKATEIYPNPCKDFVQVKNIENPESYVYEICDLSGKQVYSQKLTSEKINISELSNGIYILKVKSANNKELFVSKLIKQ